MTFSIFTIFRKIKNLEKKYGSQISLNKEILASSISSISLTPKHFTKLPKDFLGLRACISTTGDANRILFLFLFFND
jgi:hypothetical protein